MRHLSVISLCGYVAVDRLSVIGVRVGVGNLFLDQSIGINDTNTFQLFFILASKLFYSSIKTVGATVLGN